MSKNKELLLICVDNRSRESELTLGKTYNHLIDPDNPDYTYTVINDEGTQVSYMEARFRTLKQHRRTIIKTILDDKKLTV